jgi:DNA uptake protein ComE-like DNA-binding protein
MSGFRSRNSLLLITVAIAMVTFTSCGTQNTQVNSAPSPVATTANTAPTAASPATAAPAGKLNINTASGPELLAKIPNLGNRMVHEFEEYRPYRSIQQFRREIGKYVSPEQVAEYEKYIFVPINPNEADVQTLQQIPGVDATEAQALIAGRPYASADAFLSKLNDKVSPQELEVAKTYLSTQ